MTDPKISKEDLLEAQLLQERLQNVDVREQLLTMQLGKVREDLLKQVEDWRTRISARYGINFETAKVNLTTGVITPAKAAAE